jgi:hypothetical protein
VLAAALEAADVHGSSIVFFVLNVMEEESDNHSKDSSSVSKTDLPTANDSNPILVPNEHSIQSNRSILPKSNSPFTQPNAIPTVTTIRRKRRNRFDPFIKNDLVSLEITKSRIKSYLAQKAASSLSHLGEVEVASSSEKCSGGSNSSAETRLQDRRGRGRPRILRKDQTLLIDACQPLSNPENLAPALPLSASCSSVTINNSTMDALMALSTAATNLDTSLSPSYATKKSTDSKRPVMISSSHYDILSDPEIQSRFGCNSVEQLLEFSLSHLLKKKK